MNDCIFCKIINGSIDSNKLYEDDDFIVILDAFPNQNGHTLIVPKNHIEDLTKIDDALFVKMNSLIKKYTKVLCDKLDCNGLQMVVNYGDNQHIKHYHLHLIPEYFPAQKIIDVKDTFKKIME